MKPITDANHIDGRDSQADANGEAGLANPAPGQASAAAASPDGEWHRLIARMGSRATQALAHLRAAQDHKRRAEAASTSLEKELEAAETEVVGRMSSAPPHRLVPLPLVVLGMAVLAVAEVVPAYLGVQALLLDEWTTVGLTALVVAALVGAPVIHHVAHGWWRPLIAVVTGLGLMGLAVLRASYILQSDPTVSLTEAVLKGAVITVVSLLVVMGSHFLVVRAEPLGLWRARSIAARLRRQVAGAKADVERADAHVQRASRTCDAFVDAHCRQVASEKGAEAAARARAMLTGGAEVGR
jgi:hypothetical protein